MEGSDTQKSNTNESKTLAGGYSKEVTPDPIPNSVVKLFRVDGTACRLWESRSPPARFFFSKLKSA